MAHLNIYANLLYQLSTTHALKTTIMNREFSLSFLHVRPHAIENVDSYRTWKSDVITAFTLGPGSKGHDLSAFYFLILFDAA